MPSGLFDIVRKALDRRGVLFTSADCGREPVQFREGKRYNLIRRCCSSKSIFRASLATIAEGGMPSIYVTAQNFVYLVRARDSRLSATGQLSCLLSSQANSTPEGEGEGQGKGQGEGASGAGTRDPCRLNWEAATRLIGQRRCSRAARFCTVGCWCNCSALSQWNPLQRRDNRQPLCFPLNAFTDISTTQISRHCHSNHTNKTIQHDSWSMISHIINSIRQSLRLAE